MGSAILIVTFDDTKKADQVLDNLKSWQKEGRLEIGDAVVLVKDEKGKLKVHETTEFTTKRGATWGGIAGLVVGIVAGGPIGGLILGTAAGALAGKATDIGVSKEEIEAVTDSMENATSAIALQIKSLQNKDMVAAMIRQLDGQIHELSIDEAAEASLDKTMEGFIERH